MIRVALAKGYLFDQAMACFKRIGVKPLKRGERQLTFQDVNKQYEFLVVRPMDVPVYVAYGAAHLGVVGKDVLVEQETNVAELLDLKFGECDLILAVDRYSPIKKFSDLPPHARVATKFPVQAHRFFQQYGMAVELIKLYGSVELAPQLSLADAIVDLTATGETLRAHHLVPIATLLHSTARLIANPVFLKTAHQTMNQLLSQLNDVTS